MLPLCASSAISLASSPGSALPCPTPPRHSLPCRRTGYQSLDAQPRARGLPLAVGAINQRRRLVVCRVVKNHLVREEGGGLGVRTGTCTWLSAPSCTILATHPSAAVHELWQSESHAPKSCCAGAPLPTHAAPSSAARQLHREAYAPPARPPTHSPGHCNHRAVQPSPVSIDTPSIV